MSGAGEAGGCSDAGWVLSDTGAVSRSNATAGAGQSYSSADMVSRSGAEDGQRYSGDCAARMMVLVRGRADLVLESWGCHGEWD